MVILKAILILLSIELFWSCTKSGRAQAGLTSMDATILASMDATGLQILKIDPKFL